MLHPTSLPNPLDEHDLDIIVDVHLPTLQPGFTLAFQHTTMLHIMNDVHPARQPSYADYGTRT